MFLSATFGTSNSHILSLLKMPARGSAVDRAAEAAGCEAEHGGLAADRKKRSV